MKKLIYSGAGLLLIAVAFVAFNLLAGIGLGGARLDLTEQKLYTISDGTRQILGELDEPINLYFFYSDKVAKDLPALRTYAQRVEEMLKAYQAQANGKIHLHIIDPQPFSEDEDKAAEYGLQGIPLQQGGDSVYFGLAGTNSLDDTQVIPFFAFSAEVRKIIYTTNAIESLNRVIRKSIKTRGSFPTDEAATKLIYLAIRNFEKDGRNVREWFAARNQFAIMFGERFDA